MLTDELVRALDTHGETISRRTIDRLWRNPFWEERYGARGHANAHTDGRYHIMYLIQALLLETPSVMTEYAQWLRTLLVSRGMCTRHLADNFQALAIAIAEEPLPDATRATTLLALAASALAYTDGPAASLERAREVVLSETATKLEAQHPEWFLDRPRARVQCMDDLAYHFSYLVDAVACDQPEHFASYLAFIGPFLVRRGVPPAHLQAMLVAMREVSVAQLSPTDAAYVATFLSARTGVD